LPFSFRFILFARNRKLLVSHFNKVRKDLLGRYVAEAEFGLEMRCVCARNAVQPIDNDNGNDN